MWKLGKEIPSFIFIDYYAYVFKQGNEYKLVSNDIFLFQMDHLSDESECSVLYFTGGKSVEWKVNVCM